MEERMLLDMNDDVEVAGGTSLGAVLAFTVEAEPLAGRDARGDLDRQRAIAPDTSRTAARVARLGDGFSGAAAIRAGTRDRQETLLIAELSCAAALGTGLGFRTGRRSRARAGFAGLLAGDLNRRFRPGRGFLERDLEVVPQVGAALWTATAAA